MASDMAVSKADVQALSAELDTLRVTLKNEIEHAAKMRDTYTAECRRLASGEDAKILGAKQRLDLAESRVDGIKIEIAEKERISDEIQGLEAEESRRQQARKD